MKNTVSKTLKVTLAASALLFAGCSSTSTSTASSAGEETATSTEPVKIAIPDDATNGGRAIKLLETAGLITVDPEVGYTPETKDITGYLYNIEIVPAAANTLTATLDDYGGATINGTYAVPAGLIPSQDALITEEQDEAGENPYVNIIVARSEDKDNETYKTIVEAYQTQTVAEYIIGAYNESFVPAFDYDAEAALENAAATVEEVNAHESSSDGKTVVTVGVCGANNDQWKAVQKVLDDEGADIYIELQEYDAYTIPNEALNAGDIDLNAFQHKAYLNNEVETQGYEIEAIGDTLMAPLSLYSKKVSSIDELKELAGKVEE